MGGEVHVAGPISDSLGGRLAVRYRSMGGWLHNNAEHIANPYYDPAVLPAGTALLPGRSPKRNGEHEWMGRAPLEFDNRGTFTARSSEEHTSELQPLMRIPYAVFCLQKNTIK